MTHFSDSYTEARTRFLNASKERGAQIWKYPIDAAGPNGEELSIDVCRIGPKNARKTLIVSSGTHGVEGFFGSAVQLAYLENIKSNDSDLATVLIHAVNPYGFAHCRRVNEDNVDLNRNFLLDNEEYIGSHPGYGQFNGLLNRESVPSRFEFFSLRALYNILVHGLPNLKNAIAQGQYEYPKGIFYGGSASSASKQIIEDNLQGWLESTQEVIHLDLHTGLGKSAAYVLAVCGTLDETQQKRWENAFGPEKIQTMDPMGELYEIRGEFGRWCKAKCPDIRYAAFLAEFGTHPILKVIKALCEENRATHWGANKERLEIYRRQLAEMFAPKSKTWRESVLSKGLTLIDQAIGSI